MDPDDVETNIVYADVADGDGPALAAALKQRGVLANGRFDWVRFVTRNGLTAEDIDESLAIIASVVGQASKV